ncbi:CHAT domain-containing protein [Streptosporangium sp. NPDC002721]|uniref:CHAT domain-containing protein n=1 Tax=Streptosporangium sp. NPDC002721 TaxID=3366188 RepID=UPI00369F8F68
MTAFDAALRAGRVEEALRLAEASVARGGPEVAGALRDLARARIRAGRLPAAVAAAEKGLVSDTGPYEAELRMVLADAYERLGEFARAEALCVQVSASLVDLEGLERFTTLVHRNVATARLNERRGQLLRAEYLLKATLIAGRQAALPAGPATPARATAVAFFGEIEHLVHLHLGRVARKLADVGQARTELAAALTGARDNGDAEAVTNAHVEFALLADDPAEALNHLLEALWWYESPQATIRDDELRAAVRSSREELYQHAIDHAFDFGAGGMVWRLSEHARARVFLARMGVRRPAAPPDAGERRARASREVTAAARKYASRPTSRRHDRLVQALEGKERIVLGDSPGPLGPRPWGARTGVLEFFVSGSRLYSFLTTETEARLFSLPVGPGVLDRKVTHLRRLLEERDGDVTRPAEQLHHWLVEPAGEAIDRLERLVIIPYGVLTYLPFAMLGGGRPLAERVELAYAPSAAILDRLLGGAPARLRNMMIMANPHPDDDRLALPYSEHETWRIAALTGAEAAVGGAATTEAFRTALATHDIVHLACHAWFDPHAPRDSALLLADPGDPRRPGRVTVAELNEQRARARLVVLSGCQTGLADLAPGGELDGLVRAFLTAGVPSVVASLWRVDDQATAGLMSSLYEGLSAGLGVGAALRQAQLTVRAGTPHPYYWAAFCQYGSWLTRMG